MKLQTTAFVALVLFGASLTPKSHAQFRIFSYQGRLDVRGIPSRNPGGAKQIMSWMSGAASLRQTSGRHAKKNLNAVNTESKRRLERVVKPLISRR